jgi:hypothetical protein
MVAAVLPVATVLGVLTPAAGSTAAWADVPQHVKSTFPFENTQPAGAFCNFNYGEVATVSLDAIIFADKETDHIAFTDTHTNLETGFSLTETGDFIVFSAAGQTKTVGIFWHLRNAEGKLVVHQAGQLVISPAGEILKVTPDVNPDNAAVICLVLGASPPVKSKRGWMLSCPWRGWLSPLLALVAVRRPGDSAGLGEPLMRCVRIQLRRSLTRPAAQTVDLSSRSRPGKEQPCVPASLPGGCAASRGWERSAPCSRSSLCRSSGRQAPRPIRASPCP